MRSVRVIGPCALATLLTLGSTGRAADPSPAAQQDVGHRRLLDLELHPLFSIPDAIGLCLEVFPMRQGLSLRGCGAAEVMETFSLDLGVAYRFPVHVGPILTLGVGPGVGGHAIYDSVRGPRDAWSIDAFASFEAVWWSDMIGFQAQINAGAMVLQDIAPHKNLDHVFPLVDLTVGIAFRTPS